MYRNDAITMEEIAQMAPQAIVISPGPGRSEDSGITCPVIEKLAGKIPIMGVCLGHQALGQVFEATVQRAKRPVHGKTSEVFHDGQVIFTGLRNPFQAARYHSLIVTEESLEPLLSVSVYTLVRRGDGHTGGGAYAGWGCISTPISSPRRRQHYFFNNFLHLYVRGR